MLCVRLQKCCFDFETSAHSIRPRLKTHRPNFHLWVNCSFNVLWKSSGGPWICLGSQGVKNSTATITFPRNSEHASRCRLYRVNDAIFHKKHPSNLNHSTCGQTLTLLRWFMMCCPRVPSPGPLWYRDFKRSVSKEHNKKKKRKKKVPSQSCRRRSCWCVVYVGDKMNGGLLLLSAPALRLHVRIIAFVSNLLTEANPRHSVDGSCVCCLSVFFFYICAAVMCMSLFQLHSL